jgi:hypothetical protein
LVAAAGSPEQNRQRACAGDGTESSANATALTVASQIRSRDTGRRPAFDGNSTEQHITNDSQVQISTPGRQTKSLTEMIQIAAARPKQKIQN